MSKYPHILTKAIGHGHDGPPDSFIDIALGWAKAEKEEVFAVNANSPDIYDLMFPVLGPYMGLLHRKAVMCLVLLVLPGDESDWHWAEGRDTTAGAQSPDEMEAGAFQVSYNSRALADHLVDYLLQNGISNAAQFQARIKADPVLDLAYTARLLRAPYKRWDGPINRGWIAQQVSKEAVVALESLLA